MKTNLRKTLALLLTAGMLFSMLPTVSIAADEQFCIHEHEEKCWAAPAGHICSVEASCTPIYPEKTAVHSHDEQNCYDEDSEVICGLEEGELMSLGEPDAEAEPIDWICGVFELICEHKDCVFGEVRAAGEKTGDSVTITEESTAATIGANIWDALFAASPGNTVTVTGSKTNGNGTDDWISLYIPTGVTLVWKAETKGLLFNINYDYYDAYHGTFELADGGKIEGTGSFALYMPHGDVVVSGGEISAVGNGIPAIYAGHSNVTISSGVVSADGNGGDSSYAIYLMESGTVKVTGGSVSAGNATESYAITLSKDGLAAYLAGACEGDVSCWGNGAIVEVDSLNIPNSYVGTSNSLTRKDDTAHPNPTWRRVGYMHRIVSGRYTVAWAEVNAEPIKPPVIVDYPVRIQGSEDVFGTLAAAIAAADDKGLRTFTLEIIGTFTEPGDVVIHSDVTIVGAEGRHTVNLSNKGIQVEDGGRLTLGDSKTATPLTIRGYVEVTNGTIDVRDGIIINGGKYALYLSGATASGAISGGHLTGDSAALWMEKGARLSEISGGVFTGRVDAAHLTDAGTGIDKISGGSFFEKGDPAKLHGHAVFVQNKAQIDEISGGYFEAEVNCALVITRGGWVDKISGGTFVAKRAGTPPPLINPNGIPDTRNSVVHIEYDTEGGKFTGPTGIGTISGGHFSGGYYGILLVSRNRPDGAQIDAITGGTFLGAFVGLENDSACVITEISGGYFEGTEDPTARYGILNAGKIATIGGDAVFTGFAGIWNYYGGRIDEINGGKIIGIGTFSNGVTNHGTIDRISGGTIIGYSSAVDCDGINKGKLNVISGGVFWATNGNAIKVASAYPLTLEPGLNTAKGIGRYWSGQASRAIFNDDSRVVFPRGYEMSATTETLPVDGIAGVNFRYLMYPGAFEVIFDANGGNFSDDETTTTYTVIPPDTIIGEDNMPDDPARGGHTFIGWNTKSDANGTEFTGSTPVEKSIIVYAVWEAVPFYTVIYDANGADGGTAPVDSGLYLNGDVVAVLGNPGGLAKTGYVFAGWNTEPDGSGSDYATIRSATLTIDAADVTLYAKWIPTSPVQYTVQFVDWDGRLIKSEQVEHGDSATAPPNPARNGYTFTGWDGVYTNVTADIKITAKYSLNNDGGGGTDPGTNPDPDPRPDPDPDPETAPGIDPDPDPSTDPDASEMEPPIPPNHSLIPGDDGMFIEVDEDGTPLGEWHYDEELGEWIFDKYPPLGTLPNTGDTGTPAYLFLLIGLSVLGMGLTLRIVTRKRGKQAK